MVSTLPFAKDTTEEMDKIVPVTLKKVGGWKLHIGVLQERNIGIWVSRYVKGKTLGSKYMVENRKLMLFNRLALQSPVDNM